MLARFAPLLFVLLWSTGFIGARLGLPHAEPLSFLTVRYLLVLALLLPLALAMRAPWPRDGRQWLHIGISGLLVHALYLGGVFVAIGAGLPAGVTSLVVGQAQPRGAGVSAVRASIAVRSSDADGLLRFLWAVGDPSAGMVWQEMNLAADARGHRLDLTGEVLALVVEAAE